MITIDPPSSPDPNQPALSRDALTRFLRRARRAVGLVGSVDVLLTSDRELRRLNRSFRGKDKPTDVLSFPAPAEIGPRCAGDLAISLETAARQAARFGHSQATEVRILMLHGVLHLAGMDHEIDAGKMAAAEQRLRLDLGLPDTLIARTSSASITKSHSQTRSRAATQSSTKRGTTLRRTGPRRGSRSPAGAAR